MDSSNEEENLSSGEEFIPNSEIDIELESGLDSDEESSCTTSTVTTMVKVKKPLKTLEAVTILCSESLNYVDLGDIYCSSLKETSKKRHRRQSRGCSRTIGVTRSSFIYHREQQEELLLCL